jgi:hypothetical protein
MDTLNGPYKNSRREDPTTDPDGINPFSRFDLSVFGEEI